MSKANGKYIYSACVLPNAIGESPVVYKSTDMIVEQIKHTAEIISRSKQVYDFKTSD